MLWLADTAIVRKPMPDKSFYYVADAVTGAPIAKANVEFFGYRQRHIDGNNYTDRHQELRRTDRRERPGVAAAARRQEGRQRREFQWIATATTPDGRLAYLGFHNVWRAEYHDAQYNEVKTFAITDRPVYRPGQTVEFKFWIRQAQYDLEDKSPFAHQSFAVEIHNPKGEKVYSETLTSDNYGGIAGKFELPADATLGQYQLMVVNRGGGTFRVEEYKKPEFEVTVEAPTEPVMLGEKITATIRAKYYFGSPVTEATVKYKVLRSEHTRPLVSARPVGLALRPRLLVVRVRLRLVSGLARLGLPAAGAVVVLAADARRRKSSPSAKCRSAPTARSKSRSTRRSPKRCIPTRTIATRFKPKSSTNRGARSSAAAKCSSPASRSKCSPGSTAATTASATRSTASFAARRLDGKPVEGTGKLRLLKITYGDSARAQARSKPKSAPGTWPPTPKAAPRFSSRPPKRASTACRIASPTRPATKSKAATCSRSSAKASTAASSASTTWRSCPTSASTRPTTKFSCRSTRTASARRCCCSCGRRTACICRRKCCGSPARARVVEVGVDAKGHAQLLRRGGHHRRRQVHTEVREIHVPPAKRILNVEVVPSADAYKPGQHAKVTLKLTDEAGKPFVGSTVLSIFDKSLEYISGGSNVADIKEFFWKWRRRAPAVPGNEPRPLVRQPGAARTEGDGKPRRVRRHGGG